MAGFHKSFGNCTGPLDFPMQETDARDLEKKLDSGEYSPFRLVKSDAFEHFVEGERADVSVISDASVDKEGEVIDPKSLDFTTFRKNPVVAWNHNYSIPPVGKSIWQKCIGGNCWKAKTTYISKPDDYPKEQPWLPDSIFHMIKSGSMKGKSIGGAVKWKQPTEADATRLGFELSKCKRISESVEVFEYSVCPIGINSNTIVEAVSKGVKWPIDVLSNEWPEILELLKQQEDPVPIIKSFVTLKDFEAQKKKEFVAVVKGIEDKVPQLVEDCIKRLQGKVYR